MHVCCQPGMDAVSGATEEHSELAGVPSVKPAGYPGR
jgi:hypothetical protein